jgi:hypothetical protein
MLSKTDPSLDLRVLFAQRLNDLGDALQRLRRRGGPGEELAQLLALLLGVRRIPGDVGRVAVEEVRHEDAVRALVVAGGKDVGALQRLREEAEDVVDDEDAVGGLLVAGRVWAFY